HRELPGQIALRAHLPADGELLDARDAGEFAAGGGEEVSLLLGAGSVTEAEDDGVLDCHVRVPSWFVEVARRRPVEPLNGAEAATARESRRSTARALRPAGKRTARGLCPGRLRCRAGGLPDRPWGRLWHEPSRDQLELD